MQKLEFNREDVQRIVNWSRAHEDQGFKPAFGDLLETTYLKEGEKLDAYGLAQSTQIDERSIPPRAFLVKDDGVYLMPATAVPLIENDKLFVTYAKGASPIDNPDTVWETSRQLMGGDDCMEPIPLTALEDALRGVGNTILFEVDDNAIHVCRIHHEGTMADGF